MRLLILTLLLSGMLLNCSGADHGERSASSSQTEASIPAEGTSQVREFEPVAKKGSNGPTADSEPIPEIQFDREQSFGSTDEAVVGTIETFTVDGSNRVYLGDGDKTTIHVFNPEGSYLNSLGREGKGPGEFAAVSGNTTMKVHSDQLYVADLIDVQNFFPHRLNVFSLRDFSFSHTIKLLANNKNAYEELKRHSPKQFYPRSDGTFLVSYHRLPNEYQEEESLIHYVIQDSTGNIVSGPILEQKDRTHLVHDTKGSYPMRVIYSFPFFEKSLFAVSDKGYLYTAMSKELQVAVYNSDGEQIRAFRHPFDNKSFDKDNVLERYKETNYMSQLGDGVALKMIREADNLPETWPVLETMFFDDENRLWIATIVDDMDIYEWWVLKKTGEVMTKFEWPRDKSIEEIRNGKLYTRETDEGTGLEEIVRYDIELGPDNTISGERGADSVNRP